MWTNQCVSCRLQCSRSLVLGSCDLFLRHSLLSVFHNSNPVWSETLYIDGYKMSLPLYFEVGVFDFDATASSRSKNQLSRMDNESQRTIIANDLQNYEREGKPFPHRVLGTALFECGELLTKKGSTASKRLQTAGSVIAHIERTSGDAGSLYLELKAFKLNNTRNLVGKSCPFFELFRRVERPTGSTWISIYRSQAVANNLSPEWKPVTLSIDLLCNGDLTTLIKIIVWDHKRNGRHKLMGEIEMSVQGLLHANKELFVSDTGLSLNKHGIDTGTLFVVEAQLDEDPTSAYSGSARQIDRQRRPDFIEYLQGGCQISLAVAIDFTASNGDPRQPGTPHYFHTRGNGADYNDYEKAIYAVGSILAKYDSDQKFPVWGFGAKYDGELRNCFQCGEEVEVEGIQGILEAYRGVFRTDLTMASPTDIIEVVDTAAAYARHEQEIADEEGCLSYTILLILTAGNVENLEETKEMLNAASYDPISVIIVGIGDSHFEGMSFLDDHDPSHEEGRDITKFVRFNDFYGYNALTEAVLDEVPEQLVNFYYEKGIIPGKQTPISSDLPLETEDADDDERTITFLR